MKIHEYNEMMAYLTRPAVNRNIGGGTIQGQNMGYRTGFVDPNLVRRQESIQSYYDIFGKETLDKISKKKHGKIFSKLEGNQIDNLKRRVTKFKDFILKNKRAPTQFEAKSLGWSASRTLTDQGIQIKLVEDLQSGTVDINKLAKKYKIPVEELKTHAKRLERNVWKKRMGTSPLKWLSDEGDTLDNVMNSLYKSKLVQYKRDKIEQLFYDAFGDKKSKTYNPKKWAAMRKNWNEYNKFRNSIKEIFPGIKFELDHPLSKSTLRTIFNASGDQLTRVNPMVAEINNGIKKSLDTQYKNAIANKNLTSKKAIEKIARDLGINIGRVSDDIKRYNFKVNQFQNLNMGDELIKAVEQQANLAKNLPNYVKNNAELFKTAGINTKTIKPVTSINSSVINKIKELTGASSQEVSNFTKEFRKISQGKASSMAMDDVLRLGIAQSKDIANFVTKYGLGAGKVALKGLVLATPIFAAWEVQDIAKKSEAGVPVGQIAADTVSNFLLPGVGKGYELYQKRKKMQELANPEELASFKKEDKRRYYEMLQEDPLKEIDYSKQLKEFEMTEQDKLNLLNLEKDLKNVETFKMERLSADRMRKQKEFFEDLKEKAKSYGYNQSGRVGEDNYLDDLLGEDND